MRLYYDSTPTAENPTWTRVSAIVIFPDVVCRNNSHGLCTVILRDFEGALYATWVARDLTRMLVTDDAHADVANCNVIFRGYLINKKFHAKDLVLEIAGIGIELNRRSFGSDEVENYILESGYVKTLDASSRIHLQYRDDAGNFQDFAWEVDQWIKGDIDVGFMIKDTTADYATKEWDAKDPIAQAGGVIQDGDYASTHIYLIEEDPVDYYIVRDDSLALDLVITPTIEGVVFSESKFIKEIEIQYNYRIKVVRGTGLATHATVYLEINKGGSWIEIDRVYEETFGFGTGSKTSSWTYRLPGTLKEGSSPHIITEGGDYIELAKYFNTAGGNYTELKGLRFRVEGDAAGAGYVDVSVDYIKVIVRYDDHDVLPIMNKITDSGPSWIECSGVENWQETRISVNIDAFQIGQNTRKIIQDISGDAGIGINIVRNAYDTGTENLLPNADVTTDWHFSTFGDHFDSINGDDANYIEADFSDDAEIEEFECTSFTLTDKHADAYISKLELKVKAKDSGDSKTLGGDLYYDGSWHGAISTTLTGAYVTYTGTLTGLRLDQDDLTAMKFKLTSDIMGVGELILVSYVYIVVTWTVDETFGKYMARRFKGQHCSNVLNSVLKFEGAEWMEDYSNNQLKVIKKADFVDSGVSITQANYDHDWEYEDQCNQVKYVYIWGKSSFDNDLNITINIFAKAVDTSVTGENSKQIIDDSIMTVPDAQEVADTQLALLKDKRPSIRIPLNGINADIKLGTTVNVTMARPTVAAKDYPIRMIQRFRFGITGIKTIVYAGFGETDWDEKAIKAVNLATNLAHKSLTDRLISNPYDVGVGGVSWGDVSGRVVGVENVITAELVDGESIDNRIDALLTANADGYLVDPILLTEIAEPGVPAANKLVIWAEDENGHTVLRYKEADGCEVNIGEDMYLIGKNTSGAEIAKGKIVYFNGTSTGKHPNFSLAKADSLTTMPAIGITQAIVANNGFTRVMIKGRLDGLNTPWANGTILYVSPTVAGGYTNTFPPSPYIDQQVGIVEVDHAVTGVLLVDFRQMQGRNDGTIRQSFAIGDGASGDVSLKFNGDAGDDGEIVYDVSEDTFNVSKGLLLASGQVIASADEDLVFSFGRGKLGWVGHADYNDHFCVGHRDFFAPENVALRQTPTGNTILNGIGVIPFRISGITKMSMASALLTMSIPIAMGTNKITGLGDPVDNQDAATKAWVTALGVDLANYSAIANLDMNQFKIIDLPAPVADNDAVRKKYHDDNTPNVQLPTWGTAAVGMTCDGAWHDVDISGVYGAKKHLVFLLMYVNENTAGLTISMKPSGGTSTIVYVHQVANEQGRVFIQVHTDSNGVWSYFIHADIDAAGYRILGVISA